MTPAFKVGLASVPLFIAESTTAEVKSSALGEWLVIAAAVLVIVQIGWGFLDRVRGGTAQKREISFADEFATKEEHEALKDEVTKLDQERRVSVAQLHKKIDDNTALTARIEGQMGSLNQQLQQINIHLINRANK